MRYSLVVSFVLEMGVSLNNEFSLLLKVRFLVPSYLKNDLIVTCYTGVFCTCYYRYFGVSMSRCCILMGFVLVIRCEYEICGDGLSTEQNNDFMSL